MKNFFLLMVFIAFVCCQKEVEKQTNATRNKAAIDFFEPADLGAFGSDVRLIIYANFDECGEWGGHKERFEIFAKKNQAFYAKYTRTKVDCEKLSQLYGKPEFQKPFVNTEIKLSNKQKSAINDYLFTLVKSKISERYPGHSGQNFGAIKTDSTFIVNVYDNDSKNLEYYNTLLEAFNLGKVVLK